MVKWITLHQFFMDQQTVYLSVVYSADMCCMGCDTMDCSPRSLKNNETYIPPMGGFLTSMDKEQRPFQWVRRLEIYFPAFTLETYNKIIILV